MSLNVPAQVALVHGGLVTVSPLPRPDPDAVTAVLAAHPLLTPFGLGLNGFRMPRPDHAGLVAARASWDRPEVQRQIAVSMAWLRLCEPTEQVPGNGRRRHRAGDYKGTSYGAKHRAEEWSGEYVSNGAMIVAALILGLSAVFEPYGPNADIGVTRRSVEALRGARMGGGAA